MLDKDTIDRVVSEALHEDAPTGDITSLLAITEDATATAVLAAREPGTFSGAEVFEAAFRLTDPRITVELLKKDGDRFVSGEELARVSGPCSWSSSLAERIGLNFTQRMSGIATFDRDLRGRRQGDRRDHPGHSQKPRPKPASFRTSRRCLRWRNKPPPQPLHCVYG